MTRGGRYVACRSDYLHVHATDITTRNPHNRTAIATHPKPQTINHHSQAIVPAHILPSIIALPQYASHCHPPTYHRPPLPRVTVVFVQAVVAVAVAVPLLPPLQPIQDRTTIIPIAAALTNTKPHHSTSRALSHNTSRVVSHRSVTIVPSD